MFGGWSVWVVPVDAAEDKARQDEAPAIGVDTGPEDVPEAGAGTDSRAEGSRASGSGEPVVEPAVEEGASAELIASLSQRVKARWKALAEGDLQGAYGFELPSYRALHDIDDFAPTVASGPAAPRNPTIQEIDIDLPRARVALEFEVAMRLPSPASRSPMLVSHRERWLLRDGTWWHVAAFGNDRDDFSATE